jgi:hypothetical protein
MICQAKQNGNTMVAVSDKMVRKPRPYNTKVDRGQGLYGKEKFESTKVGK